jgi:hypothetical protein
MCFIFQKPAKVEFPFDLMELAHKRNSDGFGVMFMADGKAHQRQIMPSNFGQIKKMYTRHHNNDIAAHFRMQTVGKVAPALCHPFKVLDRKKHGISMFMMHNGTLHVDGIKSGTNLEESDTLQLVKQYLHPILKGNPDLIHQEPFKKMLSALIGTGNRLVFLDDTGKFEFINRHTGTDLKENVWISNTYGIPGFDKLGYDFSKEKDLVKRDPPPPTPSSAAAPNAQRNGSGTTTGHIGAHGGTGESWYNSNRKGVSSVNPTSAKPPSTSHHVPAASSPATLSSSAGKTVTTLQGSDGSIKHIVNKATSVDVLDAQAEAARYHVQEEFNTLMDQDTQSYDSMVELLVGMTEEEVWLWCLSSPEEASHFIYTTMRHGSR